MPQQQTYNGPPDEDVALNILTPAGAILIIIAIFAFCGLSLKYDRLDPWVFALPALLLASGMGVNFMRKRGDLVAAGRILSSACTIVPLLSIPFTSLEQNPYIFLSVIGVSLAGMLVSVAASFGMLGLALLLFVIEATVTHANLGTAVLQMILLTGMLTSAASLSSLICSALCGTIEWAADSAAKSERREALLRATQADLQQAIYQRDRFNSDLQQINRELETAREAAEAAYRSKSSFMAAMSHELRTPLNLIIGFSTAMLEHPEMYEDAPLPPLYQADVTEIQRSGQHLLGLINDILDFAKMEAGRLQVYPTNLALTPMLEELLKSAGALIKTPGVRLVREFNGSLPLVLADEVRVRQVLLNLLSNACKFTDHGMIGLGARKTREGVLLWVRDSGIGIAPDDQERIFRQFEQVEGEDNRRRGGTGLGLSICRWLIEMHGGTIGVKSEPGRGSVFYFTLPLAPAPAAPVLHELPECLDLSVPLVSHVEELVQ